MSWTDERVELLKKLWAEGLSAGQIATRMGGMTRNAVIGKVHRMGLKDRGSVPRTRVSPTADQRRAMREQRIAKMKAERAEKGLEEQKPKWSPWAHGKVKPVVPYVEPETRHTPQMVTFDELEPHHCKWPIGDPKTEAFRFCGCRREAGAPYCGHHIRAAIPAPVVVAKPVLRLVGGDLSAGGGGDTQETIPAAGGPPEREMEEA